MRRKTEHHLFMPPLSKYKLFYNLLLILLQYDLPFRRRANRRTDSRRVDSYRIDASNCCYWCYLSNIFYCG